MCWMTHAQVNQGGGPTVPGANPPQEAHERCKQNGNVDPLDNNLPCFQTKRVGTFIGDVYDTDWKLQKAFCYEWRDYSNTAVVPRCDSDGNARNCKVKSDTSCWVSDESGFHCCAVSLAVAERMAPAGQNFGGPKSYYGTSTGQPKFHQGGGACIRRPNKVTTCQTCSAGEDDTFPFLCIDPSDTATMYSINSNSASVFFVDIVAATRAEADRAVMYLQFYLCKAINSERADTCTETPTVNTEIWVPGLDTISYSGPLGVAISMVRRQFGQLTGDPPIALNWQTQPSANLRSITITQNLESGLAISLDDYKARSSRTYSQSHARLRSRLMCRELRTAGCYSWDGSISEHACRFLQTRCHKVNDLLQDSALYAKWQENVGLQREVWSPDVNYESSDIYTLKKSSKLLAVYVQISPMLIDADITHQRWLFWAKHRVPKSGAKLLIFSRFLQVSATRADGTGVLQLPTAVWHCRRHRHRGHYVCVQGVLRQSSDQCFVW